MAKYKIVYIGNELTPKSEQVLFTPFGALKPGKAFTSPSIPDFVQGDLRREFLVNGKTWEPKQKKTPVVSVVLESKPTPDAPKESETSENLKAKS